MCTAQHPPKHLKGISEKNNIATAFLATPQGRVACKGWSFVWMRSSRVWMRSSRGWMRSIAEFLERLAVNAKGATVMGSIPESSDTVESEGRQMKQCWIKKKNPKIPVLEVLEVRALSERKKNTIVGTSSTIAEGGGGGDGIGGALHIYSQWSQNYDLYYDPASSSSLTDSTASKDAGIAFAGPMSPKDKDHVGSWYPAPLSYRRAAGSEEARFILWWKLRRAIRTACPAAVRCQWH